jgi:hypothetical protein
MSNSLNRLYAVAYELYNRKGQIVKADFEYLHADSVAHALNQFRLSHPNRRKHRIIGGSIVVGYHALDDNADLVSV